MCANTETRVPPIAAEGHTPKEEHRSCEGANEAELSSADLRIGKWNCGGLSNVTMTLCKNLKFGAPNLIAKSVRDARRHYMDANPGRLQVMCTGD